MKKNLELLFKVFYFLLTLISFNVVFARQWYISYIAYFVIALGVVVGVSRLLHVRDYLNAGIFLLLSFVLSYILGAIVSFKYGYLDNVKAVAWMCAQYFLVFAFDKNEDVSYEKSIIFKVLLVYTGACAAISLFMMITHWEYYSLYDNLYWVIGGFVDSRLFGCYVDPNYGSILSIVSVVVSVYYLTDWKSIKNKWKVLLFLNIILELLYICYSDSRTGMISIVATTFALIIAWLAKEKGIIKSLLLALIIAALLVGTLKGIQKITSNSRIEKAVTEATEIGASEIEIEVEKYYARVGRDDSQIGEGKDITNKRIAIWSNAIEMFKQHPITGISYRNIREYAVDNISDSYIGFESMHNAFFDVLVSQGILGILIMLALIVWVFWKLIIKYKSLSNYKEFAFLFAIVIAIFVSMFTYSEVFYINTGGTFMFWYVLGCLLNLKEEKNDEVKA